MHSKIQTLKHSKIKTFKNSNIETFDIKTFESSNIRKLKHLKIQTFENSNISMSISCSDWNFLRRPPERLTFLGTIGTHSVPPSTPRHHSAVMFSPSTPQYHSAVMFNGFQGALNLVPMMSRDTSLPDG